MNFKILTLFPDLINSFLNCSIVHRAIEKGLISVESINIRDFSVNKHNTVDDRPYGGGYGMVMQLEPLDAAIKYAREKSFNPKIILMTPQGDKFNHDKAFELASKKNDLIFVCGRYEGFDERICSINVDEEISIGDYVLTGGELAAMVVVDSVVRFLPGVLGGKKSASYDSFVDNRLEYEQYTRPVEFNGIKVPDILLSGNHRKIEEWRKTSSLKKTFIKRPDLFNKKKLEPEEKQILKQWCQELNKLINE